VKTMTEGDSKQPVLPTRKYCQTCMERGVKTPVEKHGTTDLRYCTYHYWLMRGRSGGGVSMTLEDYAEASRLHFFVTSVPSPENVRRIKSHK
jgi:hypothetical protein